MRPTDGREQLRDILRLEVREEDEPRQGYVCKKLGGSSESSASGRSPKTRWRCPTTPKPVAITVTQICPFRR